MDRRSYNFVRQHSTFHNLAPTKNLGVTKKQGTIISGMELIWYINNLINLLKYKNDLLKI